MSVCIIAEAGITHGGSLDIAKHLVAQAVQAQADVVKFQTFLPDKLFRKEDPFYKTACEIALNRNDTYLLSKFCEGMRIEFLSTPGDLDSLKFLVEECGVKRIKIGSDDLTNKSLVEAAFNTGLPVILSTGMAKMEEIDNALHDYTNDLTLLHCVSLYPCPLNKANLNAIQTLKWFTYPVGYSDHCEGFIASELAVGMGATVIEKHFRPFKYNGLDSNVSLNPFELERFVKNIREVESMLGTGDKKPCEEEMKNIKLFRKDEEGYRRY